MKSKETIFRVGSFAVILLGSIIALFSLWGAGIACHFEEWVGRGLYPGVAMGFGADLYEPKTGPHITLYGPGMAIFYIPTALASHPTGAIWIAFILNMLSLLGPLIYLLNRLLSECKQSKIQRLTTVTGLSLLILGIFANEPTTNGVFKIHADLPAFSFLILSLCFLDRYLVFNRRKFLYTAALLLVLSVWAKLPALPAMAYPFIFLCLEKRFRDSLEFLIGLVMSIVTTMSFFILLYGWGDMYFILVKHISSSSWSVREHLFDGSNAVLSKMSYFEAIPLLFRFLVMYVAEYWYIVISCITAFFLARKIKSSAGSILFNLSLIYALTLPSCLSALAHFGGVENSLLFANATGIILMFFGIAHMVSNQLKETQFYFFAWGMAILILIPFVRFARSMPASTDDSPYNQAYKYLQSGKKDIYFGWYPLPHAFHSGEILTSIEVPTWVGYSLPDEINFSKSHFPPKAKYLATGPTGYGSLQLEYYLGKLKEVTAPPELSSWRLFEPETYTEKDNE